MKHTVLIIFILFLHFTFSFAQDFNTLSKSVGLITYFDKTTNQSHFATGSLIAKYFDSTKFRVYLVTNKHCIPSKNQSHYFNFRIRRQINNMDSFVSITVPIYNNLGELLSNVKVTDDDKDIAVIDFTSLYSKSNLRYLDADILRYNFLASKRDLRENSIEIGSEVYFIGYPSLFYDNRNISPILRRGIISTDPTSDYYFGDDFRAAVFSKFKTLLPPIFFGFLMDANVFGGSSGSLVLCHPNPVKYNQIQLSSVPVTLILGITADSYNDLNNYQLPTAKLQDPTFHKLNLGGVISSHYIKETIDSFYY